MSMSLLVCHGDVTVDVTVDVTDDDNVDVNIYINVDDIYSYILLLIHFIFYYNANFIISLFYSISIVT